MQDAFSAIGPFRFVIDGLLHKSVSDTMEERKRQEIFIGVHLGVGLLALASLPLVLLLSRLGEASVSQALTLLPVWMLAPLLSVAYLSKTGKLANAFLLTATLTAGFVVWVASLTGGMLSPHLIWLGVIPLEVALSGNARIVKQALLICIAALTACFALEALDGIAQSQLSNSGISIVGTLSVIAAILYAGLLAVRIEWLHRGRLGEVEAEEMHYRSLANTVSDMITRHDRSGDVTFASPASRSLIEADPSSLLGNRLFQHVHIPHRPAYLRALSDCMSGKDGVTTPVSVELQIMSGLVVEANGKAARSKQAVEMRWVEMKCAPELDEHGAVIGAIAATRDISTRKAHQKALETARQEAEQANESKIRFLANVTHELRTPLNTIIGFSEILCHPELTENNEARNREYAELIHNGGTHLLQLVNALLDMSRIESGNFEVKAQAFDISDLTVSCCKMMQTDAEQRGITLFTQSEKSMPDMNADPRACRQILLNLISNALKFSDEGDQVCVSVGWSKDHDGQPLKDRVTLSVSDTGIGIDSKDLSKLGNPFVQAENGLKRRFEGAGIGLSIVRGLTDLQHGSMQIRSELGEGTTVVIDLPLDIEEPSGHSDINEPDSASMISGKDEGSQGTSQDQKVSKVA